MALSKIQKSIFGNLGDLTFITLSKPALYVFSHKNIQSQQVLNLRASVIIIWEIHLYNCEFCMNLTLCGCIHLHAQFTVELTNYLHGKVSQFMHAPILGHSKLILL